MCKTRCQGEIEATDRQIDQLVYELYGLTEKGKRGGPDICYLQPAPPLESASLNTKQITQV
ncbi:MAG: hypothetical protein ACREQA_19340 [Candidatus Binatia bacterium]